MVININTICKVTLTKHGAEHYNRIHAFLGKHAPAEKKEGDILEEELWSVMNDFGEVLYMGNNNLPFQNNSIEISENS